MNTFAKILNCVAIYKANRTSRACCIIILLTLSNLLAQETLAKPFCSLRDPVTQIGDLFPTYTSYKSVTKEVSIEAASEVQDKLFSDLRLHSKEIGKHTIYYVYRDEIQIGLVHVRTERGPWGLVEIAWAMTPEGDIKDYRFQRCRGGPCQQAESEINRKFFSGLSFEELSDLYAADRKINPVKVTLSPDADSLSSTLIESARKTVALTSLLWLKADES